MQLIVEDTFSRLASSNGAHGQSNPFPTVTPVVGPTVTNNSQFGGSGISQLVKILRSLCISSF